MIVAVTGATGFTGGFVVRALSEAGHRLRCLIRPGADGSRLPSGAVRVTGMLEDGSSLRHLLEGSEALVKVSSLGFGHAATVVDACRAASVSRAVFFSTTSIFTKLATRSGSLRRQAEQRVEESSLDWTILRPTMIYGTERDRNLSRLIRFLSRAPAVPLPGGGRSLLQPVYVQDLATAVVSVLRAPQTNRRAYNLPGASATSLRDLVGFLLGRLGRRAPMVRVPVGAAAIAARLWSRIGLPPRVSEEQVLRLAEDKAFDFSEARRDFLYDPKSWKEGLDLELKRLREIGWIP